MSHYTICYQSYSDRIEADHAACADIYDYLGAETWNFMLELADDVVTKRFEGATVQALRLAFMLLGVDGYPVDAFCRTFLLDAYREWMHDYSGDGPVWTDSDGFEVRDEGVA